MVAIPLAYLTVEMGWLTREIGRQPWVIYGMMRTEAAASTLPVSAVATTLLSYIVIYALLFTVFIVFARRLIHRGPDLDVPLPNSALKTGAVNTITTNSNQTQTS